MRILIIIVCCFGLLASSCEKDPPIKLSCEVDQTDNTITDVDCNTYSIKVMHDGKTWMTENLNTKVSKSWCYDDDTSNCGSYGRLYTLSGARNACIKLGHGWRLPTWEDWMEFIRPFTGRIAPYPGNVQYQRRAFDALDQGGATGFNAVLGGSRSKDGEYSLLDKLGIYWSNTFSDSATPRVRVIQLESNFSGSRLTVRARIPESAHCVRCVKD